MIIKKYRKIAAILLSAAMTVSSVPGTAVLAEEAAQQEAVAAEVQPQAAEETQAPAEPQTQAPTEPQTQAPTEPQTQAPTEPQTQAPTEPQTQAPTEPQTQAPTEPQTQAPTEPQTQAPTEPQTQAPTEPQTQAPTEPQTQAPTEPQTQAPTEKEQKKDSEKKDKKDEKEDKKEDKKRSDRKNDGEKMTASKLSDALKAALPYLFAAGTVEGPEQLLAEQAVAADADGQAVADGLQSLSLKLANAKPSKSLGIMNIYADADGGLDEAQLEEAFEDRVIDVSKKYYVVNVIADSKQQELNFSGYELELSGESVDYDGTQPGDIVYNFAAMDGGEFAAYEGTVKLSSGNGLQGTFLAPEATVEVGSDLSGAVYADTIRVTGEPELARVMFATQPDEENETAPETNVPEETESAPEEPGTETDHASEVPGTENATEAVTTEAPGLEIETETVAEVQTEAATEAGDAAELPGMEAETEVQTEAGDAAELPETETQTETVTEAGDAAELSETEAATEIQTESAEELPETGSLTDVETEDVTEAPDTEPQTELSAEADVWGEALEDGSVGEPELYTDPGTQVDETELAAEGDPLVADDAAQISESAGGAEGEAQEPTADGEPQGGTSVTETGTLLSAKLVDEEGKSVAGTITIKAAETILNTDGTVLYEKNAVVASHEFKADEAAFEFESALGRAGSYYLEVSGIDASYYAMPGIYFGVSEQGAVFTNTKGWDAANKVLSLTLYKTEQTETKNLKLTLTDAVDPAKALSGAVFAVRDDRNGQIIQYINYNGTPVILNDLVHGPYTLMEIKAPEGYLVAEDTSFVVADTQEDVVIEIRNTAIPADSRTLAVSAQAFYNNTVLTAEKDQNWNVALFTGLGADRRRVSAVAQLTLAVGQNAGAAVTFPGLSEGNYYIAAVDEFGMPLAPEKIPYRLAQTEPTGTGADAVTVPGITMTEVNIAAADTQKAAAVQFNYQPGSYPEGEFSYQADVSVKLSVLGHDGKAHKTDETFYVNLYSDSGLTNPLLQKPLAVAMGGKAEQAVSAALKMTEAQAKYYLAETDADGKLITASDGFAYAITYPGHETGDFQVDCGVKTELQVQNKLNDSDVKIRVEDASSGALLPGAVLVIKNSGKKVITVMQKTPKFESESQDIVLTNILEDGATYYLSEVTAPGGYTPASDLKFTVKKGGTTEVVLKNAVQAKSDYALTVTKQVYSGKHQLYAYDTTTGQYAEKGYYTYYAALFSDAKRTKKVSNVEKITVNGFGGTATFSNLKQGETYYVAETNQYGQVLGSSSKCSIRYANSGKVQMSEKSRSTIIQNVYTERRAGYRYTGSLTLALKVLNASDEAEKVTKTFYAGIYRKADYSDKPTVVKLDLKDASSVSVKRRILLSGDDDMTYYIAEVDAQGNRITDESSFEYTVSIDKPTATITKSGSETVTLTNKVKSTKATLYLTKRVYDGSAKKQVNATFYAGLFKDAQFTQLYTKPIPLKLENKSELTLKLSLKLGSTAGTTVYIAEVDKDGKVIKNQRDFGYQIRVVNSTAAFTQDKTEIQAILINSVFGSTTSDDWNNILSNDDNNTGSGEYISGNGIAGGWYGSGGEGYDDSEGGTSSVQTGDETPVGLYIALLAGSLLLVIILVVVIILRKRNRK